MHMLKICRDVLIDNMSRSIWSCLHVRIVLDARWIISFALFDQHICFEMFLIRMLDQKSSHTSNVLSIIWFDLQYVRIDFEMLFIKMFDQELFRTNDVLSMKIWWHVKQLYAKLSISSMTYIISCFWICFAQSSHR